MNARPILFVFFLLVYALVQAQSISGLVTDLQTGEPVPFALLQPLGSREKYNADSAGRFSFKAGHAVHQLHVTRIGYQPMIFNLGQNKDDLQIIRLTQKEAMEAVVITAGAERVFTDPTLHLYDYEFADDGLFVIVYDRERHRSELALVDRNDSILRVVDCPEQPGKLVKDCLGQIHVLTKHFSCQIFVEPGNIIRMYQDSLEAFQDYVAPCLGYSEGNYYFRQDRLNGQVVDYFRYDASSTDPKLLLHITDREKIYQMLDPLGPYVQFASTEEGLLSIPPVIWDKINKLDYEMQFNRMAFFYPIHAPLRVIGGDVWVFDHTNKLLRHMAPDGKPIDSLEISYPNLPKWDRQIIVDEVRGEAYTSFERHGYITLREIDLKTGELGVGVELPKQFPMKIQIKDGVAYFMYREQEPHDDTNRLWRMRIKD